MDRARGLINYNVGHILDAVMTICMTKRLSETDSIHIIRDTFVNETSWTQTLKKMLERRGPLLFTAINIEELPYINTGTDKLKPYDRGFVAGGGKGNNILSNGWKRGEEVLVGRLSTIVVLIPSARSGLRQCLNAYSEPSDWVHWLYCVPIKREYPEGSYVARVRDHVVNKYRCAIRGILKAAHNQCLIAKPMEAVQTDNKDLFVMKELGDTPDFFYPPIPDPIPTFVNDIWVSARQMAEDKWNDYGYRVDDNDPDAPGGAEECAMLLKIAESMKRRLDKTETDGNDGVIESFRKKQRLNTPPPPQTEPVQLQDDVSQETLIGDKVHTDNSANNSANSSFESQSGGSADSSFDEDVGLGTVDVLSLATAHELSTVE
ncbi:hypothetical protein DAEQUDRAFT_766021 [Daedalea quercina L-15889]|uniref:Uncharacterized protein n=1 Tax=Daedalea quercina L-15889 TaxID=1314783 RepID=A0A165PZQ7_9APHY|nr:hypothetical protein DAEQUDRAFT_766021 [Daedalea quercina L-15889]